MKWFWSLLAAFGVRFEQPAPVATCGCCAKGIAVGDMVRHHPDEDTLICDGVLWWDDRWSVACMHCAEMPCDGTGRLALIDGRPTPQTVAFEELYA